MFHLDCLCLQELNDNDFNKYYLEMHSVFRIVQNTGAIDSVLQCHVLTNPNILQSICPCTYVLHVLYSRRRSSVHLNPGPDSSPDSAKIMEALSSSLSPSPWFPAVLRFHLQPHSVTLILLSLEKEKDTFSSLNVIHWTEKPLAEKWH